MPEPTPESLRNLVDRYCAAVTAGDLDAVIADAAGLFEKHPPESLRNWGRISNASALKTGRRVDECARQGMAEGYSYFETQRKELRWAARREKAMKTVWANRTVIIAVVIGIGAVYLRKAPFWTNIVARSVPSHYF